MDRNKKYLKSKIRFNVPHLIGDEIRYIKNTFLSGMISGGGKYTKDCQLWLEKRFGCKRALLTNSCTAALEMMAILCNLKSKDEVIMPSFTFVSTANAFVLRGVVPVFIDVRGDTFNLNEKLIENAITEKTKAIVVVHYAGVGCEMNTILKIAKKNNLIVLEDNAQGFLSKYNNQFLGTFGDMSAVSFHETKNVISGEGGSIWLNKKKYIERAEIVREKGTNRTKFYRGEVDKYSWVDVGSSYIPNEMTAAFLKAQLEKADNIVRKRILFWQHYHCLLKDLEDRGVIKRPFVPKECVHNGHIYYIVTNNFNERSGLIEYLKRKGILSVFHYIPLHSSQAGKKFSRFVGNMKVTKTAGECLLRLPMYYDLKISDVEFITESIKSYYKKY